MVDCLLLFASFKNIKLTESQFQMNGCKIRPIININQLSMALPVPIFETFRQRSLIVSAAHSLDDSYNNVMFLSVLKVL